MKFDNGKYTAYFEGGLYYDHLEDYWFSVFVDKGKLSVVMHAKSSGESSLPDSSLEREVKALLEEKIKDGTISNVRFYTAPDKYESDSLKLLID